MHREVGDAPSLKAFRARLDGALSYVVEGKVSLSMARGWNKMSLKAPSNPNPSVTFFTNP